MNIDDIKIVGSPLVLASPKDVRALEQELWITLPQGYFDYITRLGEGVLGGSLVRIYPPWRIRKELNDWRERINTYWFWEKGEKILPKARAVECVIVGDTVIGDELVFHPCRPNHLFVLPRNSDRIFEPGEDLLSAIEWMCSSGKLCRAFKKREFEPFDTRLETETEPETEKVVDPPGETLADVIALCKRWTLRRHLARKGKAQARKMVEQGQTLELAWQSMVFAGAMPTGYMAVFTARNAKDELVGKVIHQVDEDSESMSNMDPLEE